MAHTYWRLLFTAISTGNLAVIDNLSFFDSGGTLISTAGGTASASSTQAGSSPANAFNGIQGSWWISNASPTAAAPQWLRFAFASPVDVASFVLAPRQTAGFGKQWPSDFALQYSDDGSSFTTLYQYYGAFSPGNSGASPLAWTCDASNAAPSLGVAWRLLITATDGTAIASLAEWKMYDSGGTQISTSRIAAPSSSVNANEGDGGAAAFDGNINTYWASNGVPSGGSPEWLAYWFSDPTVSPASFSIQARAGSFTQTPHAFSLQYSFDGTTWTTTASFTATTWTSSQVQTFGVTPVTRAIPQVFIIT